MPTPLSIAVHPNDTKAIRARNRAVVHNSAEQRRRHAILAVEERVHAVIAGAIYRALEHGDALSPVFVKIQVEGIVDTVTAILRGGKFE